MGETSAARDAALLRAILDDAVDAIITIDERGAIQSVNRAAERIFGYAADEMIGNNIKMLMPRPYSTEHDAYLARYVSGGTPRIIGIGREVEGMRKGGEIFPMHLGVSEVVVGETRVFTGIVQDISERRALEEAREALIAQLEAANAELERFTYTVSHDLKSPLITIKGFLGMLEQDAVSGNFERLRADVDRIGRAADKMTQLLDELLELSRVGRVANPASDIAMTELCTDVVHVLEGPIAEKGARVSVAPGMPVIRADRVRISEVVQNLIENALKFAREGVEPEIEIGARDGDPDPVFFVRDNGLGIDPEYLERVFRLFEQLDQAREGTGIGLALVKRIIEVHGGRIWVESDGKDQGASFFFSLPAVTRGQPDARKAVS